MNNNAILRRTLYAGTGFVIIVTLILVFIVIPSVIKDTSPQAEPEKAVPGILFVIIIHLVIVAAMARTILVNERGGRIDKGLLIGLGVLLLFFSLMVLDGASAYSGHTDPIMKRVTISMYIGASCNAVASVLTFLIAWYSKRIQPPLK